MIVSRHPGALSELYDRYSRLLYGVIVSVVRDTDDAEDILRMGEQEYARYLAFTEFEEARNAGLPRPAPAATTGQYASETAAEAAAIRKFLAERDALTIPDYVGPYRRTLMPEYVQAFSLWAGLSGYGTADRGAVKYSVPEDHPYTRTYWESIMRIDPSTNIFHDGIPGHHFQGVVSSRHPSPIRSARQDRFKSEGWSTYWEETAVQLGYYDDRPRSRELIYNFLRLRALRVVVDVRMATGDMSVDEAIRALMTVPMDRRIASEEADDFFAAPTGGTGRAWSAAVRASQWRGSTCAAAGTSGCRSGARACGSAPSASRNPNSRVRWATLYAMTP